MKFIILSLIPAALCITVSEWLNGEDHGQFNKTIKLGSSYTSSVIDQIDETTNYLLVLPTDDAWNSNEELYSEIEQAGESKIYELLTRITATSESPIKAADDFPTNGTYNMNGDYIIHKVEDGNHVIQLGRIEGDDVSTFKQYATDGPIVIDNEAALVLDNVSIFAASKFSLPSADKIAE